MANELKKFLDAAGVGHLWGKVTEKIDTEVTKEADRAKAAEKALGDKLTGIDTTVVDYVTEATKDIASGAEVEALTGRVETIEKDYAKTADVASTYETKEVVKTLSDDYAGYKTANNAALAAVKATADAAAVKADVDTALAGKADKTYAEATEAKVAKLIGDDTNKSVRTIANEELAAQLIPESAAESLDTLQEIAAWIQAHPGDVAAINKAIKDLQDKVVLGTDTEGNEYATVKAYVEAAIAALQIGDYAKAADLVALAGRVTTLEAKPAAGITADQITNWEGEVGAKALAASKATMAEVKTEIDNRGYETVTNVGTKIEAAKTAVTNDLTAKIATAKGEAIAEAERLNGLMDTRVQAVEAAKHTHGNKDVLDGITAEKVASWDGAQAGAEAAANAYADTLFGRISALTNAEIDAAIGIQD